MSKYQEMLSSHDLFLELEAFSEGRSVHAWRCFGAHPAKDQAGTRGYLFRLWAPNASQVCVIGDFNDWDRQATPMDRRERGIWEVFVPGLQRHDAYQYAISHEDGTIHIKSDPFVFYTGDRSDGASVLYALEETGYHWNDGCWLDYRAVGCPDRRPLHFYECHLGSWRRTGEGKFLSYRDTACYLVPYVKEMGFTHVALLPLTEYLPDAPLGDQCAGYFAATSRFGTPDDLKYLIDQLHQAGIGVYMDWVPSNFSQAPAGLSRFDGPPLYERPDGPPGQFDLNRGQVRSFLLSSALFWLEEFHLDGLRVCGLSASRLETAAFFQSLRAAISSTRSGVNLLADDTAELPLSHHQVTEEKGSILSRMPGDNAQKFAGLRAFYAYRMALPGPKLTFMGTEFGQWNGWRWQYSLDWHLLHYEPHRQTLDFFQAMNFFYLAQPALWDPRCGSVPDGFHWLCTGSRAANILAFLRRDEAGAPLLVVCNFSPMACRSFRVGVPFGGTWTAVFHTDEGRFGGKDGWDSSPIQARRIPHHGQPCTLILDLPPMSVGFYQRVRTGLLRRPDTDQSPFSP